MIRLKDTRFRFIAILLCALIIVSAFVPIMNLINTAEAAGSSITIYFDTSYAPSNEGCTQTGAHGTHGWSTGMENVYYHAWGGSKGSTGDLKAMTPTGKAGKNGGKLFSLTFNEGEYGFILFSSATPYRSDGDDYYWQTWDLTITGVSDKQVFGLNGLGYGENKDGVYRRKQQVNAKYIYSSGENYSGGGGGGGDYSNYFSILNMTNSSKSFKIRYTDETKNLDTDTWNDDKTFTSNDDLSSIDNTTVNARHYAYKMFTPPSNTLPYQTVEIWDANHIGSGDSPIKKYYFPEGKILGRTFMYGVSQLSGGNVISYQSSDLGDIPAMNTNLYLDNASFYDEKTPAQKTNAENATVKEVGFTYLGRDGGNSQFRSIKANPIIVPEFKVSTLTAGANNDMSSYIYSLSHNGSIYNMFAAKESGDNLICINDNVAAVSGKYTLQSINNVLTEDGTDYIYATTLAEMFDYQYDTFNYTVTTPNKVEIRDVYPGCVLFTRPSGWGDPKAYFFNDSGGVGNNYPGTGMTWVFNNEYGEAVFKINIPAGATHVIFSDGNNSGTKTSDIKIGYDKGFYLNGSSVGSYNDLNNKTSITNLKGEAKRPYLTINEAISASPYATTSGNYPMYLGQFWMRMEDSGTYSTSAGLYNSTTAPKVRAAHDANNDRYNGNDSTNHDNTYGFGNELNNFNWSANLAYRNEKETVGEYKPYNAVVQGLVKSQLKNGKLMALNGENNTIPYFDLNWWNDRQSFGTSQGNTQNLIQNYIKHYPDLTFPFFKTASNDLRDFHTDDDQFTTGKLITDSSKNYTGDYYVFDSKKNVVRYDSSLAGGEGDLKKYYDKSTQIVNDNYGDGKNTHSDPGLFPFNGPGDSNSKNLHYGFGVKFSFDFYLNENGTIDGTKDGTPITFTFQGDDDVWVFLDDQLVLDMGGAHKNAIGEINFAKNGGHVTIGSASTVNNNNIQVEGTGGQASLAKYDQDFNNTLKSIATTGKHTITMFYLERGMLNSNLYVMFNLPMSLTKWELQQETEYSGVNAGFAAATKYVADRDVFNYAVKNKDTKNVVGSEYKTIDNVNVTRTNTDASRSTTLSTSGGGSSTTNNFNIDTGQNAPDSDGYQSLVSSPSGGVTYRLFDMYGNKSSDSKLIPVFYDTRQFNNTGQNNVISLQHGELATFNKQFTNGSMFKVTQLDNISSPVSGSRTSYDDNTGRTVSKYYNTYFQEEKGVSKRQRYAGIYRGDDVADIDLGYVETMYGDTSATPWGLKTGVKNYSTNYIVNPQVEDGNTLNYNFRDPKDGANEYVHLRQVVVNEVKTAKLVVQKKLLVSESSPPDKTYTFTIQFRNVFGTTETTGVPIVEYTSINYKKYKADGTEYTQPLSLTSEGTFTLKLDERIEIDNIPVGTKYYVTEGTIPSGSPYVADAEHSIASGTIEAPAELTTDTTATMFNSRPTGSFKVVKVLKDTDGTTDIISNDTEFDATIVLTKPSGIDSFAGYDIRINGVGVTVTSDTGIPVKLKVGSPVTVTGLPADTTYTVSEGDVPTGYAKLQITNPTSGYTVDPSESNVEYNTASSSHKISTTQGIVNVYNILSPIIMPSTGGTPIIFLFPAGITAIALSFAALLLYKRKQNKIISGKERGKS